MIIDMFRTINAALAGDDMTIEVAEALLRSIGGITGKAYYIVGLRVCYKEDGHYYDVIYEG